MAGAGLVFVDLHVLRGKSQIFQTYLCHKKSRNTRGST